MCKLLVSFCWVLDALLTFLSFRFGISCSPVRVQAVGCATHLLRFTFDGSGLGCGVGDVVVLTFFGFGSWMCCLHFRLKGSGCAAHLLGFRVLDILLPV